ncbi:MAG TPA: PRC-barrel domain-containing protein [Steroidobacteraceae bacterium]|nr:PRC-barrel domain-containing protein [Steroidobacteraceae bacterium]
MNTLKGLSILAGLSLAGAAYAQSPTMPPDQPNSATTPQGQPPANQDPAANPPTHQPDQANPQTYPAPPNSGNTNPSSASSPHQRDLTSQSSGEAQTNQNPDPTGASTPHQRGAMRMAAAGGIASGMDVQSHDGKQLGTVTSVVKDSSGKPAYVVIADQSGSDTAMPYMAAKHMVKGNKLMVDQKRLQNAPKVPESQLQDTSNTSWQGKADSYWKRHGKMSD